MIKIMEDKISFASHLPSPRRMKKLALLKWQYIVDNDGSPAGLTTAYPDLGRLTCNCSFCHYIGCNKCPIRVGGTGCMTSPHPHYAWAYTHSKEDAQKVLDLIKGVKVQKLRRIVDELGINT